MSWTPDQAQLKQLAGFLRDSLSGRDQNAQKHASQVLSSPPTRLSQIKHG